MSIMGTETDPLKFEEQLEDYLTQLKFKRTLKVEDDEIGPCAEVLSSPQVSEIMQLFFGPAKAELKEETRELLKTFETVFKEVITLSHTTNGSKAEEALMELTHNPEYLAFSQILGNDPADWVKLPLLRLIDEVKRKEAIKEQLTKDIKDIQHKRREVIKDSSLATKQLTELKAERCKKEEKLNPTNVRRQKIALESYKSETDKLEAAAKSSKHINPKQVTQLLEDYESLKIRHETAKEKLGKISANGVIPPDVKEATRILLEREAYLNTFADQVNNALSAESGGSRSLSTSFNDSVFM